MTSFTNTSYIHHPHTYQLQKHIHRSLYKSIHTVSTIHLLLGISHNSFPNRSCTNEDQNTYIETPRFHNPLFEEQQQSTSATPLSTKPKPPQRQSEEPVYAISLVTNRRNIEEPKSIQNGPNHTPSGERLHD